MIHEVIVTTIKVIQENSGSDREESDEFQDQPAGEPVGRATEHQRGPHPQDQDA